MQIYACMRIDMHRHTNTYICMQVHTYTWIYMQVHAHIQRYIDLPTHALMHVQTKFTPEGVPVKIYTRLSSQTKWVRGKRRSRLQHFDDDTYTYVYDLLSRQQAWADAVQGVQLAATGTVSVVVCCASSCRDGGPPLLGPASFLRDPGGAYRARVFGCQLHLC